MDHDLALRDANLAKDAAKGNEEAFAEIMTAHEGQMVRLAMVILGDPDAARDAVQAAWPRAWNSIRTLRQPERLHAWLMSIVANQARQHRRAANRRFHRERARASEVGDGWMADPGMDPRLLDLHAALQTLSETDRELIALRYMGGMTAGEIAVARQTTDSAVRGRLARLLVRLRLEMGE